MRLVLVLALALLAGCAEAPPVGNVETPRTTPLPPLDPEEPLAFRTVLHTTRSPVFDSAHATQLDVWQWNETWDLHATGLPEPWHAKPRVDFANETLVRFALGEKDGACHDVRVTQASRTPRGLFVRGEEYNGSRLGRPCAGGPVWPTHIVAVQGVGQVTNYATSLAVAPFAWDEELGEAGPEPVMEPLAPLGSYSFRTLAKGQGTSLAAGSELVTSARRLAEVWPEHTRNMTPAPPVPEVDFEREHVLVQVGPIRSGRCQDVEVDSIAVGWSFVVVRVAATTPPPGASCREMPPFFHITTYPLTAKPALPEEARR